MVLVTQNVHLWVIQDGMLYIIRIRGIVEYIHSIPWLDNMVKVVVWSLPSLHDNLMRTPLHHPWRYEVYYLSTFR